MLLNNQTACIKQIIYEHRYDKIFLSICTYKNLAYFKSIAIYFRYLAFCYHWFEFLVRY